MRNNVTSSISRLISRFQREQNRNNRRNRIAFTILAVLLTTAILGYLIYSQKELLLNYDWSFHPAYLGSAFIVYTVILAINVLTWASIMHSLGSKVDIGTHFRSTTISALGKRLPGTLWYVWWRAEIYKENFSTKIVTFASAIEMSITIIAAVIVCALFAIPIITQYKFSLIAIIILFAISLASLHPRVMQWLLRKMGSEDIRVGFGNLLLWVTLYFIIWILVGVLLFNVSNIVTNISPDKISYFIGSVALTGILSRLLLFSPSTFGITEVSLSLLLSAIMPSSVAVVVALANRILIMSFEVIWAFLSIILGRHSDLKAK
jgi:glycosyltransferase 2 family protein